MAKISDGTPVAATANQKIPVGGAAGTVITPQAIADFLVTDVRVKRALRAAKLYNAERFF